MRIYDLAKELGERFGIKLKSSDLATEIKEMAEFASIRDTIRSHASTLDEDSIARLYKIYENRHEAPKKKAAEEEAARKKADAEKVREEILLRRRALDQQRKTDQQKAAATSVESARLMREAELKRRQEALKGKLQPLPAQPRPAPLGVPLAKSRPVTAPLGAPLAGGPKPAAPAPAAVPGAPVQPAAIAPVAPPAASAAPAAPVAAPPPPSGGPVRPVMRPTAPAAQLRSSSGTTGMISGPAAQQAAEAARARGNMRADGQPLPPPPPTLRADSPFRARPVLARQTTSSAPPPRGGAQGATGRSDAPQRDDRGPRRPGGPGRGAPGAAGPGAGLVIPEIGVMTLKGKGRGGRGGPAAKDAKQPAKKKGLKTIVHEEFEVKPSKVYGLADEFRRPIAGKRPGRGSDDSGSRHTAKGAPTAAGPVKIGSLLSVAQFAEKVGLSPSDIIKKALMMGQMVTMNQMIDPDLCELVAQDLGIQIEIEQEGDEQDIETYLPVEDEGKLAPRPPVVTIMGHVDHGKTTLLDAFRESAVVESEFGGITQHIGAYRVQTPKGEVVFLDTPGHAAFTSMRARGAQVTDIVVLVVAADDGAMPQTVEAISHAKEAKVPIIVAINKMDLPQANPQRVRQDLMQHSILPEELGGDNIFVEISAKKKQNLDGLLDAILLQAEVLELKSDPTTRAEGTIIESHMDPLRGAMATVLIQKGTLRLGDVFVVGSQNGRVRLMIDDRGKQVEEATPAHPVEVIGLTGSPDVGDTFLVMPEERIAREIAQRRSHRRRLRELASSTAPRHVTLEGLHDLMSEGKIKELKVILKADVQGSLEAVSQSLQKLGGTQVKVRILHQGVGGINENDVTLAGASDAILVGFNVRPDPAATDLAEREGIDIKTYRIIYELIEEFQKALVGMLDKKYKEIQSGRVEIRKLFRVSKVGVVAGCMVLSGEITRNSNVRLVRNGVVVFDGKVASLRRIKDDAARVAAGYECGVMLEKFTDIKEGDIIEAYTLEEIPAELVTT